MSRIRPAQPTDVAAIVDIGERGWRAAYGDILSPETIDTALAEWYDPEFVETVVESDEVGYFVVERDGAVAGYASASPAEDDPSTGSLHSIYVDPDCWGEGLGTALLDRVESFCREQGCDAIRVRVLSDNEVGQSFYSTNGYDAVEECEADLFGESVTETVLRRRID